MMKVPGKWPRFLGLIKSDTQPTLEALRTAATLAMTWSMEGYLRITGCTPHQITCVQYVEMLQLQPCDGGLQTKDSEPD